MHAEHEPGTQRGRPTLPLTVPLLLALAVWVSPLLHLARRAAPAPKPPQGKEDPVAGELRRFHDLTEPGEQIRAISRLGPVRDPRVTVLLMEVVQAELDTGAIGRGGVLLAASYALYDYHIPEAEQVYGVKYWIGALMWWQIHEAEVRQRAASLPR